MAMVLYDANGNPIIDPYGSAQATNRRLPPEAPTSSVGGSGQQSNQPSQSSEQPPAQTGTNAQNPSAAAGGTNSTLQNLLRLFGGQQNTPQQVTGPTQAAALAQGTQVGPATPAPNAQTGVNTNPVGTPAAGGLNASQASAIGSLAGIGQQLGEGIKNSVGSWQPIQSAIPDPSAFIAQEQRAQYQYDFQRHPIV